jgi:hypothetical protein
MRFVLLEIYGNKARLATRTTRKDFWTNVDDLIFIQSKHNERKGKRLMKQDKKNLIVPHHNPSYSSIIFRIFK